MPSPVPYHEPARVRANGVDLTFDSFGERSAPPLLLIMGLGTQMTAWRDDFCSQLAARGFWVVRFDNRDIGLSSRLDHLGVPDMQAVMQAVMAGRPVNAPYSLSDMAADCIGLLDALEITSAHMVGASMGGTIAQTLAIEHPQRVRTLTSIMATSGAPGLPPPTPAAMQMLFTPAPTDRTAYIARYLQLMALLRGPGFPLDEATDVAQAEQNLARGLSVGGTTRQLAAIFASGNRKPALASVKTPTLVIHGDADPLVPLACGIDVAESVPGANRLIIPRMGHTLPISMWPQIIDAIAAHATAPAERFIE